MTTLEIRDLVASVGGTTILNGITLTVNSGEVHAVMGPNGAGKSTLSAVVMGKPGYEVISGSVMLDGVDMLALPAWQRAQAGLHLVMQYPTEVPGVQLVDVMRHAFDARGMATTDLGSRLYAEAAQIGFDSALFERALNVDLSGGEKKRNETLQLALLAPLGVLHGVENAAGLAETLLALWADRLTLVSFQVLLLLIGAACVLALVGLFMVRAGVSLRPIVWFAVFFGLVVLTQAVGHLLMARRPAPAEGRCSAGSGRPPRHGRSAPARAAGAPP